MQAITDKIRSLPPELQREVEDFVDFLLAKTTRQEGKRFLKQDWAGGLAQFKSRYVVFGRGLDQTPLGRLHPREVRRP